MVAVAPLYAISRLESTMNASLSPVRGLSLAYSVRHRSPSLQIVLEDVAIRGSAHLDGGALAADVSWGAGSAQLHTRRLQLPPRGVVGRLRPAMAHPISNSS